MSRPTIKLDFGEVKLINQANQTLKEVRKQMEKTKQSELFFKAFLKPIQIVLKTGATEGDPKKIKSLPYGLKQVIKGSIDENKFALLNFQSINDSFIKKQMMESEDEQRMNIIPNEQKKQHDLKYFQDSNCDNLISLMKSCRQNFRLKLAICVCVYNQNKTMLRQTLNSINRNIETFIKNGVSYNDIGVFVFIDGIETVHPTLQEYFEELENDCNIFLAEDAENFDVDQMKEEGFKIQDIESKNFNHLIFDEDELRDFRKRRFSCRKKQYKQFKAMIIEIEKLQKEKNWIYDNLNPTIQRFFIEQATEQYKRSLRRDEHQMKNVNEKDIIDHFTSSYKRSNPLVRLALQKTKKYLKQYISTRDNIALLNSFRVPIKISSSSLSRSLDAKMNLFLVTKYKNRGKLSSHNWFFNGFCQQLKPEFAILLDVGLVCDKNSLWRMYSYMRQNEKVGGVCGYMQLRFEKTLEEDRQDNFPSLSFISQCLLNCFDIQRAQQFQYHYAHLINKPFESCFNFIHVLPGAFSGYRMAALRKQDEKQDSQLLKHYFSSIQNPSQSMNYQKYCYTPMQTACKIIIPDWLGCIYNCFYQKPAEDSYEKLLYDKNIYLAEDRILCMGLHQNGYNLTFLPDAYAEVDSVKNLRDFLGQRRRWMNGSYFAFDKVRNQALKNGQWLLKFQILYLSLLDMITFLSPGLFFYTNHLAMNTILVDAIYPLFSWLGLLSTTWFDNHVLNLFVPVMDFVYVIATLFILINGLLLNNRDVRLKLVYYATAVLYGFFSYSFFIVLFYSIFLKILDKTDKHGAFICHNSSSCSITGLENLLNEKNIQTLGWVVASFIVLYIIPLLVYTIFKKFNHIVQILLSAPSFIFYSQTYLNTLSIYSLCKIDDISWGTKGLDSDPAINKSDMVQDWRNIKIINVCKYVLYNLLAGTLFYVIEYKCCQFKVFFIMIIPLFIGFTFLLRIVLGAIYVIIYRIKTVCKNITSARRPQKRSPRKQQKLQSPPRKQRPPEDKLCKTMDQIYINDEDDQDFITERFNSIKQYFYQQIRKKIKKLQGEIKNSKSSSQRKLPLLNVVKSRILYTQRINSIIVRQVLKPKPLNSRICISKLNYRNNSSFLMQNNQVGGLMRIAERQQN